MSVVDVDIARRSEDRFAFLVGCAVAAVAAVVLGAIRIGRQSLWLDELYSRNLVAQSWAETSELIGGREVHNGAYYLALWPWRSVIGESEAALRSLSVLFGVAAVVLLMVLARRLFGTRTALLVAPIFLVHAQTIRYFQEARTYSLVMLAATGSTLMLVHALDRPGSRDRWMAYGVVAGMCWYVHLFVLFVVASHVVALVARRALPSRSSVVAAASAFALVTVPLAIYYSASHDDIDWVPATTTTAVRETAASIVAGGGHLWWLLLVGAFWSWYLAQGRRRGAESTGIAVVVSWVTVPVVIAIVFSFVKPVFVERYLIVCVPAAALLTAAALNALIDRVNLVVGVGALAVVLAYNGQILVDWYEGDPAKEDYRSAMAFACAEAGDDGFVTSAPDYLLSQASYYSDEPCGASSVTDRIVTVVRFEDVEPPDGWSRSGVREFSGGIQVHTFER